MDARKVRYLVAALATLLVLACLSLACARPDKTAVPELVSLSGGGPTSGYKGTADSDKTSLKVMTLNVAHGRRNGVHQVFQCASTHKANLDAISRVIRRERPDVVALQEADGPSYWSGNFNHVDYLARAGKYPHYLQFEQARGMGLSYGTALISELPLGDLFGRAFETSTIAAPKGFLVSMIEWPAHPGFEVDVVSVHFDPVSDSIREKQMEEFVNAISGRNRPIILMGDFNCEWTDSSGILRVLAERLDLTTFLPDAVDIMTFRRLRKRLDWIFVSSEFEFVSHSVLPDSISDHQGVVAEISLRRTDSEQTRLSTGQVPASLDGRSTVEWPGTVSSPL